MQKNYIIKCQVEKIDLINNWCIMFYTFVVNILNFSLLTSDKFNFVLYKCEMHFL